MRAATVVQQVCKSCRTCFKFYCMFYSTCDRSFSPAYKAGWLRTPRLRGTKPTYRPLPHKCETHITSVYRRCVLGFTVVLRVVCEQPWRRWIGPASTSSLSIVINVVQPLRQRSSWQLRRHPAPVCPRPGPYPAPGGARGTGRATGWTCRKQSVTRQHFAARSGPPSTSAVSSFSCAERRRTAHASTGTTSARYDDARQPSSITAYFSK